MVVFAILLIACFGVSEAETDESGIYVKPIDHLKDDFILGMDVSSVVSLENSGVRYFDETGKEKDLFEILADHGVNYIRVRVWVDPFTADGKSYGGGGNDLATAIKIGQRATKNGMKLLVDFHYSDFWADPSKQQVPKAWEGMKIDEKAEALYQYTKDSLQAFMDAGVDVGMVQLGNETNGRLCGEKIWKNIIYKLMAAGAKATREIDPRIQIAVHFANPENAEAYLNWASKLDYYHLDYDVFATSYYPYWHGTLENLKNVLSAIRETYQKDVMVAETSYAYTIEDTDFSGNTIGEGGGYEKPYPFTVQGQANEVRDVADAVNSIGGIGVFYWEGAWISVGQNSWEENHHLWETYGSGWASSFAGEYDPNDAGKYFGGSACDNQAMFDANGRALDSLNVFRLLKTGNTVPLKADSVEELAVQFDIGQQIALPDEINCILNDNSRSPLPVTWNLQDSEAVYHDETEFDVYGSAGGMEAKCHVMVMRFNYAKNFSFEDDDLSMWVCTDRASAEQLYCEEKKSDSLTGSKHWHFYSSKAKSIDFSLEQSFSDLPAGTYRYRISIMGGDSGDQEILSYVSINSETVSTSPARISAYNQWDTPELVFTVHEGDTVILGISVRCDGAGAWGKIDDMYVNSVPD